MSRQEIHDKLSGWGWKPSIGYAVMAGGYRVDLEQYDKLRGFMVTNGSLSSNLWVSERELETNIAVKFFLENIANK